MKSILMPAALALALAVGLTPAPLQAAGCLEGAAVGGVAGHFAGHHGLLGLVQAVSLGATRQTSTRVYAPSRTGYSATAVSPATAAGVTPLASAKATVVPKKYYATRGSRPGAFLRARPRW
jgi:hypothetical protein